MFEKAFEQALKAQNSNALYLAFDRLIQRDKFEIVTQKYYKYDCLIKEHLYRFLKLRIPSLLNKIQDPY